MYLCRDKIGLKHGFTEIDPWQRRNKMGTPYRLDTETDRKNWIELEAKMNCVCVCVIGLYEMVAFHCHMTHYLLKK